MFPIVEKKRLNDAVVWVKLKAPLIALCGGAAEIAGGIRYLLGRYASGGNTYVLERSR